MSIQLIDKIQEFDIPVVMSHDTVTDPTAFVALVRDMSGVEGFIIAWSDGYRVKLKAEEYVRFHKTKDGLAQEKNVIASIVKETIDDEKSFMSDDDRHRVEKFEQDFWAGVAGSVERYDRYYNTVVASGLDRKRYALEWMPTIKKNDPVAPMIVFGRFEGRDTKTMLLDHIRKNTGTQTAIDSVRDLWGNVKWNYHFEGDN